MDEPAVVNFASEPYSVALRGVPLATIGEDEVLLEVKAVGVCGSDLHMWTGDHNWRINYPVVLGHEFSGIVCAVGLKVHGFSIGERVVGETHAIIDHQSPMTRRGLYNLDPARQGYGAMVDGAMRSHMPVPARILHRIPDTLSFEKAALTEPSCVAYNTVAVNSNIKPGDRVMVLGPGPIGLLCAAVARLCGADVAVVGLERDRARLQIAEKAYGCTSIIDNVNEWAKQRDGLGVDGVIDAAGISATLKTALQVVRPAGWITKVGWGHKPLDFSLDPLVQKNVHLQGSFSHNWPIWQRVIQLLADGSLDVEPIIGGLWPLEQWREAFDKMHSGKIVKAVLTP